MSPSTNTESRPASRADLERTRWSLPGGGSVRPNNASKGIKGRTSAIGNWLNRWAYGLYSLKFQAQLVLSHNPLASVDRDSVNAQVETLERGPDAIEELASRFGINQYADAPAVNVPANSSPRHALTAVSRPKRTRTSMPTSGGLE